MKDILFSIGELNFTLEHFIGLGLTALLCWLINGLLTRWFVPRITRAKDVEASSILRVKRHISLFISLFFVLITISFLDLNLLVFQSEDFNYNISHFIFLLMTIQGLRILFWFVTNLFIHDFYTQRDTQQRSSVNPGEKADEGESVVNKIFRSILIVLGIISLLRIFKIDHSFYEKTFENGEVFNFRISSILISILIFLLAQLFIWLTIQIILYSAYKRRKVDQGAQFAINQLFKYVVYVFATILALDNLGLDISILLGGAAALLVGIGLGLQQTFNDFISGLVLLFERTVSVGDVLEVGSVIGIVKKIGLRASTIETRGNITMVVPNSKLVHENVVNWTHFDDKVRFDINIGVAYGSDTKLVKDILIDVISNNPYVINYPAPFVRFLDFGDNSLDFKVYFFSRNFIVIEDIKSDMRFEIDQKFRENKISIPFPQRDVWMRSDPKE